MFTSTHIFRFIAAHPLTRSARIKALARVVGWQIKSRLQTEVIVPWIGNQKLAVKRGMTGATGNIYAGLHEFPDMMFLLHFLRGGDLFLDIGANVGTYTVLASGVCNAITWAFEPDPKAVLALKRNIETNRLQELVTVHETALGATDREVPFTIDLDTANKVWVSGDQHCRIVHQKQLDSLIGESRPTFAKLDVEGYEEEVLLGAKTLLAQDQFQAIELETVTPNIQQMLAKNSFKRVFYDPFKRVLSSGSVGTQSSNALFIKEFDFVYGRLAASPKFRVLDSFI
jgi:FkbM family methyltransferase